MLPGAWRLVYYVSRSGRMPVKDFLDDVAVRDPSRYAYFEDVLLPLLNEHGPGLGGPHVRKLAPTAFWEIRWSGSDRGHHRLYCTVEPGRRMLLLHGCTKRWRRFDPLDRQVCRDRHDDYRSGGYDAATRLARA